MSNADFHIECNCMVPKSTTPFPDMSRLFLIGTIAEWINVLVHEFGGLVIECSIPGTDRLGGNKASNR